MYSILYKSQTTFVRKLFHFFERGQSKMFFLIFFFAPTPVVKRWILINKIYTIWRRIFHRRIFYTHVWCLVFPSSSCAYNFTRQHLSKLLWLFKRTPGTHTLFSNTFLRKSRLQSLLFRSRDSECWTIKNERNIKFSLKVCNIALLNILNKMEEKYGQKNRSSIESTNSNMPMGGEGSFPHKAPISYLVQYKLF